MTKEQKPTVLQVARALYGGAFQARSKTERGEAIRDWLELSEGERSYAMAHLIYLNLESQAATQALLREIRETLEATEDAVKEMADEVAEMSERRGDGSPGEVELPEPEPPPAPTPAPTPAPKESAEALTSRQEEGGDEG